MSNSTTQDINIPVSRGKFIWKSIDVPSIIFFISCAFMLYFGSYEDFIELLTIYLVLPIAIWLFSYYMIPSNSVGIIITGKALIDKSTANSLGEILWTDIQSIKLKNVFTVKFLVITVNNPEDYIDKVDGAFKKRRINGVFHRYGSPIIISANGLSCSTDELLAVLLRENFKNKNENAPTSQLNDSPQTYFCSNCGKQYVKTAELKFCYSCGNQL